MVDSYSPEWQTLSQRLSNIVYNKEHPVGIAFYKFCMDRHNHYADILRSIDFLAPETTDQSKYGDFYVISEEDFGLTTIFLQRQCNIFLSHVYQISELLADGFSKNCIMIVRKIRLCYEKCLYKCIGHELISIYRLVYAKTMQALEERMTKLKSIEMYKLNLQMRSEWWLELFNTPDEGPFERDDNRSYNLRGFATNGDSESDERTDFITDFEEDEYCDLKKLSGTETLGFKNKMLSLSCSDINNSGIFSMDSKIDLTSQGKSTSSSLNLNLNSNTSSPTIKRSNSISAFTSRPFSLKNQGDSHPYDTFEMHFGHALRTIKKIFFNPSPLKKMQCLTDALKLVVSKVEELRMRDQDETLVDRTDVAVTAEDLLPLLVLLILKMSPYDVSKLYVDLIFVSDLMAEFLSTGCHSYALCEFQIAFLVLDQTYEELGIV